MKKIFIVFLFISLYINTSAQDRKVDYLGLVFKQEHYRKVVRKSEKLIYKKGYDKNAKVYLYQAAALAKLSEIKNYTDIEPNALDNAIQAYSIYYELDKPTGFVNTDKNLIKVLQKTFNNKIDTENTEEALVYLFNKVPKQNNITDTTSDPITVIDIKDSIKTIPKIKTPNVVIKPIDKKLPHEEQIICYAKNYLGIPYLYGGKSDKGFDCSGFTGYVLEEFGYKLPRSARDQHNALKKVPLKKAKKGDLVFFGKSKNRVTHVGLVVSKEGEQLTMIHASSSRGIMISNIETNTYWKPKLISAGRIIN
jgi:cell wall-associated NlpC family hydrolase